MLGGFVGGLVPSFWGSGGFLSFASVVGQAIGGILGIYIGFKISE